MARRNRISLPDATYHVTTRIAHQAMLLSGDAVMDRVFRLIYDCAVFSGVEVLACCVMNNHLHILLHVPKVPEEFWTDPGVEPCSHAFGMRPPECRTPVWQGRRPGSAPPSRPGLGFMLDDGELLRRLSAIYGAGRAAEVVEGWRRLERAGCAERAEAHRERLCRRMYNVSQYMKTLKESVTRIFNSPDGEFGHVGALWQGRFHSGVVEPEAAVLATVAAYIAYNPVRAGTSGSPGAWRWSSFACALGDGPMAEACRMMYGRMLGCAWDEARARMEAIFADGLPDELTAEAIEEMCGRHAMETGSWRPRGAADGAAAGVDAACAEEAAPLGTCSRAPCVRACDRVQVQPGRPGTCSRAPCVRASQAIHVALNVFRGAFIGSVEFALRTLRMLPPGFPSHGVRSARLCSALAWEEPPRRAA